MSSLSPEAAGRRQRVRAGGRSELVRRRVGQACLALLASGDLSLGPVVVARRAGVSRATLHRWWPTKADLLQEALSWHTRSLRSVNTGTLEGDVGALVAQLGAFFAAPVEVGLNVLMASGEHPELNEAVLEHYRPLFDEWRAVFERAMVRGELDAGLDVDAVLLLLTSPLLVVPLLYRRGVPPAQADALIALVLRAIAPLR